MTAVRLLSKHAPRRKQGSGTITLRAEKGERGRLEPVDREGPDGAPRYRWLYRSPHGGSKTLLATDRQHAAELARDWERDRPERAAERGTFAALVGEFLGWKEGRPESTSAPTVAAYRRVLNLHVLPVLGSKQAAIITPDDVTAMLDQAKLGPRSANGLVTLVGMVFDYALERGRVTATPIRRKLHRRIVKEHDRQRRAALQDAMPTEQEVRDFIAQATTWDTGTSAGVALALAMETGLRREELLHLRREDVTLTDTLADVRIATDFPCGCRTCAQDGGKQRTKNRHRRYVPLTKRAEKLVGTHLARLEREATGGPWLFPVLRHAPYMRLGAGSQMHREHLDSAMKDLAEAVGITLPEGCNVHFCRHVALTRWEVAGLTKEQRDLASGHEAEGVRATYSHGDRVALFKAFREKL